MSLKEINMKVKDFLYELLGKNAEIISIIPYNEGWTVTAELLLDEEYTMSRGRNDLLHAFNITLDGNRNITSYTRIKIRERGKIDE